MTAGSLAAKLWKEKGLRGLYKGTAITALRDVSFSCVYFPMVVYTAGITYSEY